jgi:hypothetical protein
MTEQAPQSSVSGRTRSTRVHALIIRKAINEQTAPSSLIPVHSPKLAERLDAIGARNTQPNVRIGAISSTCANGILIAWDTSDGGKELITVTANYTPAKPVFVIQDKKRNCTPLSSGRIGVISLMRLAAREVQAAGTPQPTA